MGQEAHSRVARTAEKKPRPRTSVCSDEGWQGLGEKGPESREQKRVFKDRGQELLS